MTFTRPPRPPDLEAIVGVTQLGEGGRGKPIVDGYRASHDFGLPNELNDALHEYPDTGRIEPGETGRANIWLLAPDRQAARLFPGMLFSWREGSHVVGDGRIVEILNERLARNNPICFEIDGARVRSLEEFYDEISRVLVPHTWWGRNLDALNDILRGGFGTPDVGFRLVWREHQLSRQHLGYEETVRQLEARMASCHPVNRSAVANELANARVRVGPTVFDWLIEIIRRHGQDGRESADGVELDLT